MTPILGLQNPLMLPFILALLVAAALAVALVRHQRRLLDEEAAPPESEGALQSLFDQAPVAIWREDFSRIRAQLHQLEEDGVTDLEAYLEEDPDRLNELISLLRITHVNPATLDLLEAPDTATLLSRLSDVFTAEALEVFRDELVFLAQGKTRFQAEADLLTLAGHPRRVAMRLAKDPEDQNWSRVYLAMIDISGTRKDEQKRNDLERRLTEAQKLDSLGCLAGGVAHDFNNLLMSVLGNADLALQEIDEDAPAAVALSEIHNASLKAADLCQQMLAYAGRGRLEFKPIDLNEMTLGLGFLLRSLVPRKIQLRQKLSPLPPVTQGDASQLQQVVVNLITNSVEAIDESPGQITLETGMLDASEEYLLSIQTSSPLEPGRYVFLRVEDDGPGIPESRLSQIFDPFFTTKLSSRGMGLAAVLGIARMHHGGVLVDSSPEIGTTMTVLLPLSEKSVAVPETTGPSDEELASWQGSGRILLADDEPGVRRVATRMLDKLGFEIILAEDGQQAVEIFHAQRGTIDFVILDLTMPRLSGHEALQRMRELDDETPIILSSGYSERESLITSGPHVPAAFIPKPYTLKRLRRALSQVARTGSIR